MHFVKARVQSAKVRQKRERPLVKFGHSFFMSYYRCNGEIIVASFLHLIKKVSQ